MVHANRLPSGSFRARAEYRGPDGSRRYKSFTVSPADFGGDWRSAKREAEFLARQFEREHGEGEGVTVASAVASYIRNRSNVVSPSTLRSYRQIERCHISGIKHAQCRVITSAELQSWINTEALTVSPKTIKNIYSLVVASLQEVCPDRRFTVTLPKLRAPERHIPDDADVRALLASAPDDMRLLICLAAVGSLRLGEACALRQEDILRDTSAIYVHGDVVRNEHNGWVYKDFPKTAASVRTVVLPADVMLMFPDTPGLIFEKTPGAYSCAFVKLRNKLGLKCRFHDLRHYSASFRHALKIPDQYVQAIGGWSSSATLRAVYEHALPASAASYTKLANDYFSTQVVAHSCRKRGADES